MQPYKKVHKYILQENIKEYPLRMTEIPGKIIARKADKNKGFPWTVRLGYPP